MHCPTPDLRKALKDYEERNGVKYERKYLVLQLQIPRHEIFTEKTVYPLLVL